jgi:hypothetical protein
MVMISLKSNATWRTQKGALEDVSAHLAGIIGLLQTLADGADGPDGDRNLCNAFYAIAHSLRYEKEALDEAIYGRGGAS